jgi:uncharacterized protein YndB with AHSA1/START domain
MSDQARVITELADDHLLVAVDIPGATPADVVAAFCEPDRLRQWWGGSLTFQPYPGGAYVVHFPQLSQTMRGSVRAYAQDGPLSFTWAWDHEPDLPQLLVTVDVTATPDGVQLRLEHGPYDDASRSEAHSHREGWEFFLPRLVSHLNGMATGS